MPLRSNETGEHYPTTARLMKMLESSPNSFKEMQLSSSSGEDMVFHKYLNTLLDKKNLQITDLITGAFISKSYAYQFTNGERLPGRDIVLRMALYMKIKVAEAQRLLTLAGKSVLYPKIRRDAAILFCLQKGMSLDESNSFLEDLGEETIV